MCIVNSDKGKYEFIILDLNEDIVITSFKCMSISTVARLLDEFNFDRARPMLIRLEDNQVLDPKTLLEVWRMKYE